MSEIITFQELERRLFDQPKNMERALIKAGLKLGFEAENLAKQNATTFPRVRTGRLFQSINPQRLPNGRFGFLLRAGGQRIKGLTGKAAGVPADVEYAAKIEFGDSKLQPRLFMGRAMQDVQDHHLPGALREVVRLSLGERA